MRVVALVFLLAAPVAAQIIPLRHLGQRDGIGEVDRLALAPSGDLWIAGAGGLARHDGVRTVPVPLPGADGPAYEVEASPSGDVWVWAPPALYRRRPDGSATRVEAPAPLARLLDVGRRESIGIIALPNGGLAVFSRDEGLWVRTAGRWQRHITGRCRDVVLDGDRLWVLTPDRLGRLAVTPGARIAWDPRPVPGGMHVRPHPDGAWVLGEQGLWIYHRDGRRQTVLDESHSCWFGDPDVRPDGTLALTETDAALGVTVIGPDGEVRQRITGAEGLPNPRVLDLVFDGDGGLFLGSVVGLSYVEDAGRITRFPLQPTDRLSSFKVSPVDGTIWMTTYGGGVYHHDGARLHTLRPALPDRRGAGFLYVALDGAARWVEWTDGRLRYVEHRNGQLRPLPDAPILQAEVAGREIFTWSTDQHLTWSDGTPLASGANIRAAVAGPAPTRRIWVMSNARLASIQGHQLAGETPETPASVRSILDRYGGQTVTGVAADRAGRIWVSTRQGLLSLREVGPDEWVAREHGTADGVPVRNLEGIHLTGERLWLGSADGLFGFRVEGDAPRLIPVATPGLASALPHRGVDRVTETMGALWVVPHGPPMLIRYRAGARLPTPPVRLSALIVNGRTVEATPGLRLRTDTTRLALSVAPSTFRRLGDVRYAYRLVGRDDRWATMPDDPTVRFESLPPGTYTFKARAERPGQPPGPVLSVPLTLVPPFYQAGWFQALLALAFGAMVAGGAWRRVREGDRRRRDLERIVAQRTEALTTSLATVESQAGELRRMDQARSRLFQNISHELRTPLTLLLGPLRDATSGALDAQALDRQLPAMERNAHRLHRLVTRLLDLARLDAGHLRLHARETDWLPFVRAVVLAYADRARRDGITLSVQNEPASLQGWMDRDRMEEAVTNLIENALKFTEAGGKIRVTLLEKDGYATVRVGDTGRGIAADVLPHVFDRFRQGADAAAHPGQGAGIGLALVREVVERHGGRVGVTSEVGFGSTFTLSVPLDPARLPAEVERVAGIFGDHVPTPAADVAPPRLQPAGMSGPSGTVLVVEDNADLRAYLREHLAPIYAVEEAVDGAAGLEAARRLRPDLVISDVMMPTMDGFALCRALKADADLSHVPVVLLTARADEASRLDGLAEGADDYLVKPFHAAELLARCENLIEVRRRLRARFSGEVVVRPTDVVIADAEAVWLDEVTAVIEAHIDDTGLSVERLAEALAMSTRALQRRLKAASGLTPAAYLRTVRLQRAAQLLEQGAGTVAEVAYAVGYRDPDYFGRVFRQGFGMTPSAFASSDSEA